MTTSDTTTFWCRKEPSLNCQKVVCALGGFASNFNIFHTHTKLSCRTMTNSFGLLSPRSRIVGDEVEAIGQESTLVVTQADVIMIMIGGPSRHEHLCLGANRSISDDNVPLSSMQFSIGIRFALLLGSPLLCVRLLSVCFWSDR